MVLAETMITLRQPTLPNLGGELTWTEPLIDCGLTQISLQTVGQIQKMSPFSNPLIKGFQMM